MASKLAGILESYRGRDSIIRIACYASMLAGGVLKNRDMATRFSIFAGKMAECRTMLRLFDDLSWFLYVRKNGLMGLKDDDLLVRITKFFSNLSIHVFYPVEHIAWAMEKKILNGNPGRLEVVSIICWLICLVSDIIQSMWLLIRLKSDEARWRKQRKLDLSTEDGNNRKEIAERSGNDRQLKQAQENLARRTWFQSKQMNLFAGMIGSLADMGNAVHWSTTGFLWAGKLPQSLVGLLGTISSACLFYNYLYPVKPWEDQDHKDQ